MQTISNSIQIAHQLLLKILLQGGIFVDGTMGNGYDTYFLAKYASVGSKIYAFDIQQVALDNTRQYLKENLSEDVLNNINLICASHDLLGSYVQEQINGAIFNLGYLPNGEKNVTTLPETTLKALNLVLEKLAVNGVLAIVLYPGHDKGLEEYEAIEKLGINLPKNFFTVGWYKMVNHNFNAPTLCWIEKVRDL